MNLRVRYKGKSARIQMSMAFIGAFADGSRVHPRMSLSVTYRPPRVLLSGIQVNVFALIEYPLDSRPTDHGNDGMWGTLRSGW